MVNNNFPATMYERMITRFLVRAFQYLHNNAHRDSRVVVVVSLIHLPVLCHILPLPPTPRINDHDRFRIGASRRGPNTGGSCRAFVLCCVVLLSISKSPENVNNGIKLLISIKMGLEVLLLLPLFIHASHGDYHHLHPSIAESHNNAK